MHASAVPRRQAEVEIGARLAHAFERKIARHPHVAAFDHEHVRPFVRDAAADVVRQRELADDRARPQVLGLDHVLRRRGRGEHEVGLTQRGGEVDRVARFARQSSGDRFVTSLRRRVSLRATKMTGGRAARSDARRRRRSSRSRRPRRPWPTAASIPISRGAAKETAHAGRDRQRVAGRDRNRRALGDRHAAVADDAGERAEPRDARAERRTDLDRSQDPGVHLLARKARASAPATAARRRTSPRSRARRACERRSRARRHRPASTPGSWRRSPALAGRAGLVAATSSNESGWMTKQNSADRSCVCHPERRAHAFVIPSVGSEATGVEGPHRFVIPSVGSEATGVEGAPPGAASQNPSPLVRLRRSAPTLTMTTLSSRA